MLLEDMYFFLRFALKQKCAFGKLPGSSLEENWKKYEGKLEVDWK